MIFHNYSENIRKFIQQITSHIIAKSCLPVYILRRTGYQLKGSQENG